MPTPDPPRILEVPFGNHGYILYAPELAPPQPTVTVTVTVTATVTAQLTRQSRDQGPLGCNVHVRFLSMERNSSQTEGAPARQPRPLVHAIPIPSRTLQKYNVVHVVKELILRHCPGNGEDALLEAL
ncbi:hypothetical protein VTJ04DRAFT_8657 [Mycothermus thermophilus]|uniref:uncharacterized protein n=1 Tax=Humicola insolens TaxID=85995 RepID=UPI00374464F1